MTLTWYFIRDDDPVGHKAKWGQWTASWIKLFKDQGTRFKSERPITLRLADMTAEEYVESDLLDLEGLSKR